MDQTFEALKSALADRYLLERELGAGGMATVFLAHDPRHNRKVAVKVMHPDLAMLFGPSRFLKEIETTANLQHPHILPLFDSGQIANTVFYVMPYLQGESLRARINREKQLPVADAIHIANEVASGLGYAHRQGVVHRDIKPDNVLFHDGRAMIADFGIALARSGGDTGIRLTKAGVSLGTPQYMSPEQASGVHDLDPRTDIYSLGAVLYEMLSGQPPFVGPSVQTIVASILADEPVPLEQKRRSVPHHVSDAVERALEKLPADRWQTAAEFGDALAGRLGRHGNGRLRSAVRAGAWIPWAGAAAVAALAIGFGALRLRPLKAPASTPSAGPVRFDVEFDSGVTPTVTPVVRLSPDGRQLFVTGIVGRQEEVLRRRFDQSRMQVIAGAGQGDQGTGNSRPLHLA